MKENKNENVCERNFDGRFFRELCREVVQQFTSEGPMNCFGGLFNRFASEGSPIYLQKLGSVFSRTKSLYFENDVFLALLTLSRDHYFQVQGVYRRTTLTRGRV